MLTRFITAGCLCAVTAAYAESGTLSREQVRDLVAGAVVEIDTPVGTKIPIRYTVDGQLSGQARDLAWYLGSQEDIGRWWIDADQLCHKWRRWFDGEQQCMRLQKSGQTIHWLNKDGKSGTAAISVPAPARVASVQPPARIAPALIAPSNDKQPREETSQTAPHSLVPLSVEPLRTAQEVRAEASASSWLSAQIGQPTVAKIGKPEPTGAAARRYMVTNVDRDDVLNVRSGPSADFDVVAELQPGSRGITITGACQSQWCPVWHEAATGWVNRTYLAGEERGTRMSAVEGSLNSDAGHPGLRDPPEAPRSCLTAAARALLERIEEKFGPVKLISTCRPGATIAGSGRPSRHASGNAVDFSAGSRKREIVEWLVDNHHDGGTMTYADMDHIHVDIGPHFVSIAGGRHWASWRDNGEFPRRQ
jgi:Bacterial SH3 domain